MRVLAPLFAFFAISFATKIDTVSELNIDQYSGTWYQMYSNLPVLSTFEKDNVCVTAQYGPPNPTIKIADVSVKNTARLSEPTNGTIAGISGYAYIPDHSEPGKLKVHFDEGAPFDADYWVAELGPINSDNKYDYAIVTDNIGLTLYVLGRDANEFYMKYDSDVLDKLNDLGFSGKMKQPIPTYQDADCEYSWLH
jgi:apolipoprotein D and lipocalin family protein